MKKIFLFLVIVTFISFPALAKDMVVVDSYEIIDAKPGERVESSVYVTNPGNESVDVEVWVQDWKTVAEDGKIIKTAMNGAGVLDQSLAPYLELKSATEITIEPRETISIPFVTDIPEDKNGTYWTAIVVAQYITPEPQETEGNSQVKVRSRAAFFSKIIRANSQNDNLKPWISFLSIPKQTENGIEFEATLENKGEVAFFFPCQLSIYEGLNKDNNPIAKVKDKEAITRLAPFYLFPGEKIKAKVNVPVELSPGVYTAKLKIMMERGEYAPVGWREFRLEE